MENSFRLLVKLKSAHGNYLMVGAQNRGMVKVFELNRR